MNNNLIDRSPLLVTVHDLSVSYGEARAVNRLSFRVPRGEIFGFIGPNGAGKTTTFKVLATLLQPDAGTVRIGGYDLFDDAPSIRRIIGYAPDFFGVYDDLTVREYLHFFAAAYHLPLARRRSTVGDALALTDLEHKADANVDSLSRGMKQRLSIARILLHDPELLILDEPASGLDPRARIEMRELLKELKNMGKTILISSHILHELSQMCTRIAIVEAGRFVAEGSLQQIYEKLEMQRIVHLQLANPDEDLLARIRAIDGVHQVDEEVDRLAIRCREGSLAVEDLHDAIVAAGGRIRMFQPQAMDMETVFMKLTEGRTD